MGRPTNYTSAPSLAPETQLYTQLRTTAGGPANFKFTLQAIYNFFKQTFGFSETVKHLQTTASSTWTITHNLGRTPVVQAYVNNALIIAAVSHVSVNQTVITFNSPQSGYALLNP